MTHIQNFFSGLNYLYLINVLLCSILLAPPLNARELYSSHRKKERPLELAPEKKHQEETEQTGWVQAITEGWSYADLSNRSKKVFAYKKGDRLPIVDYKTGWFKVSKNGKEFGWISIFKITIRQFEHTIHSIGYTLEDAEPLYRQYLPKLIVKKFLPPFTPFILLKRDVKPWGIFLVVRLESGEDGFLHLHSRGSRNLITGRPLREHFVKKIAEKRFPLSFVVDSEGYLVPEFSGLSDGIPPASPTLRDWGLLLEKREFNRVSPWLIKTGKQDLMLYLSEIVFKKMRILYQLGTIKKTTQEWGQEILYRALYNPLATVDSASNRQQQYRHYFNRILEELHPVFRKPADQPNLFFSPKQSQWMLDKQ